MGFNDGEWALKNVEHHLPTVASPWGISWVMEIKLYVFNIWDILFRNNASSGSFG
jgi:hypothetical protein